MARVLDTWPGRATLYPWGDWLDGRVWELAAGEDFHVEPESIAKTARGVARSRGMTLRVTFRGKLVILQAEKR